MTPTTLRTHGYGMQRRVARLMVYEAAALAIIAVLHLTGILAGGSKPFDPKQAGIVEAIIGVVLAVGAGALMRNPPHSRIARSTIGLSIVGFIIGLVFTIQGGDPVDLAFHLTMLPLLSLTLLALRRTPTHEGATHDRTEPADAETLP